jgi:hypothetical protein
MSFLSVLKTIGEDVEKGIAVALPIVGDFVPQAAPILNEVATVIGNLETAQTQLPQESVSTVVKALSTASTIKQHAATLAAAKTGGGS